MVRNCPGILGEASYVMKRTFKYDFWLNAPAEKGVLLRAQKMSTTGETEVEEEPTGLGDDCQGGRGPRR